MERLLKSNGAERGVLTTKWLMSAEDLEVAMITGTALAVLRFALLPGGIAKRLAHIVQDQYNLDHHLDQLESVTHGTERNVLTMIWLMSAEGREVAILTRTVLAVLRFALNIRIVITDRYKPITLCIEY